VQILAGKQKIKLIMGLFHIEQTIETRRENDSEKSYVASLFQLELINNKKVGEEAIEVVIEAKDDNDDFE
jgi:phosphoribosyl-ATP pyrophosphohydrolase/phosphoribosyl-AMP cyclohydrolase